MVKPRRRILQPPRSHLRPLLGTLDADGADSTFLGDHQRVADAEERVEHRGGRGTKRTDSPAGDPLAGGAGLAVVRLVEGVAHALGREVFPHIADAAGLVAGKFDIGQDGGVLVNNALPHRSAGCPSENDLAEVRAQRLPETAGGEVRLMIINASLQYPTDRGVQMSQGKKPVGRRLDGISK